MLKVITMVATVLYCCLQLGATAQEIHFADTIKAYNRARITTNARGASVLNVWGVANIGVGCVGYFTAKKDEWKYFHEMNAIVGAVNTTISGLAFYSVRKQAKEHPGPKAAYARYKSDKATYLSSIVIDAAMVGAGAGLVLYSADNKKSPGMYLGFGRSLVVQGVCLLAFDNIMYRAHLKYNSRWAQLLEELRFTGAGFSFNYNFPAHPVKG